MPRSQLESSRDKYILKGITCDIKPREKIGIVGRTGAGKSSLVRCRRPNLLTDCEKVTALFRLNEGTWGNISIDGVRIADLGLKKLRQNVSIIPQDPVLFHGKWSRIFQDLSDCLAETIRWNLDPFEEFTDQEIWDALEQANIKPVCARRELWVTDLYAGHHEFIRASVHSCGGE